MPKIAPFYSIDLGYLRVYHDNSECAEGQRVRPEDRRPGTGDRPRCDECLQLERERR
jgi:hypothetical protein